ncbi:ABC transporter permease [Phytoactinopolyspora limicola]|uniref:ABC transporter permease n=1 Tax=Phytoactinopolyspora limicola TaxID=2715536 RepID=UPI0014085E47|nr:ABC transporter permease [Phytoactinopolyspora limicola]
MAPPPSVSRPGTRLSRRLKATFWFFIPFVALAVVWIITVEMTGVAMRTFPQLNDVRDAIGDLWSTGDLFTHVGSSLRRVMIGAILAVITAVPFGILLGSNRWAAAFFSPLLRFSVALAGIAWIPLATLWLGYGERAVIFIVWNAMFFAITYNAMLGVQRIPTELWRAARSLGTPRWRMFGEVFLPGALPNVVTGLRVGLGYGWRGLVAAEVVATSSGLGYSIFQAQQFYRTDVIVAMMVIIGVLWLITDRALLAPLERRTVERWGMKAVTA